MIFRDSLFKVQVDALNAAGDRRGFCYFMEQGLGKTRTVIHEFHEKVTRDLCEVLFVVCGRTMRGGWRDEVADNGYPYPVILVKDEKTTEKHLKELKGRPVVIVCHYELMLTRGNTILKGLIESGRRVYVAADESFRISGHESKISDRLYLTTSGQERVPTGPKRTELRVVGKRATFIRALTGTPAPEGPHNLWAQFRFVGEMEKTPYFAFRNTYCQMGGHMNKKVLGGQNLDILRARTGHFVFRATKDQYTDLPEKIPMPPRDIEMEPEQKRAYLEMLHEQVVELGNEEYVSVEMAISAKTKLQQIASGWIYDNEQNPRELVPPDRNPKLLETLAVINETPGKILVFYHFRPSRDVLAEMAERHGIGHLFLEGGLSDAEFERRKAAFNTDDQLKVAFCQIAACKEGLTLLGTPTMPCHTSLYFENTYSLYSRAQSEDRNHRHGQKYPVTYQDIACSREDREIVKALQKKKGLQEAIMAEFEASKKAGFDLSLLQGDEVVY